MILARCAPGLRLAKAFGVGTNGASRNNLMRTLASDSKGAVFVEYLTVLSVSALALSMALMVFGVFKARVGAAQCASLLQRYP